MGPLIPLFWASGDVYPVIQSQGRYSHIHALWRQWIPQLYLWCNTCRPLGAHLSTFIYLLQSRIFTIRNEVMFLHVSVILFIGGCYPSMHCRWYPSMPCSRGSAPGGCLLRGGGVPASEEVCGDPPSESRRLLLRTERILLEC